MSALATEPTPAPQATYTFQAVWPIVDEAQPWADLIHEAETQIRLIAARAHARITSRGSFRVEPSDRIPGSGRVTKTCLVFEAPAVPAKARPYHRSTR